MVTLCELIKYTQLGTTSAENLIKLHFIRIRRCDEMYLPLSLKFCAARVFWEVQKQILSLCSYKKVWKPTAFHSFASPNDKAKVYSQTLAGDLRVPVPLVSTYIYMTMSGAGSGSAASCLEQPSCAKLQTQRQMHSSQWFDSYFRA